jgi:hypothetical protein
MFLLPFLSSRNLPPTICYGPNIYGTVVFALMIMFCWMVLLQIYHALQGAEGSSAGTGTSDLLLSALNAAVLPVHDKEASQAPCSKGFLKEFLKTANTPEGKELGLEEAAKTFMLMDEYMTNMGDWEPGDETKHDAMANGMLKLMEDPNWNKNTVAELLCVTRETQARAAKTSGPILSDTRYGTAIQLKWCADDTSLLLNASALYTRYVGGFLEQDAMATIMTPYLKCMFRLKLMAEVQSNPAKGKRAPKAPSARPMAASQSSLPQAMALREPKSRGSQGSLHHVDIWRV